MNPFMNPNAGILHMPENVYVVTEGDSVYYWFPNEYKCGVEHGGSLYFYCTKSIQTQDYPVEPAVLAYLKLVYP